MIVQVLLLMPIDTTVTYQYRYGNAKVLQTISHVQLLWACLRHEMTHLLGAGSNLTPLCSWAHLRLRFMACVVITYCRTS